MLNECFLLNQYGDVRTYSLSVCAPNLEKCLAGCLNQPEIKKGSSKNKLEMDLIKQEKAVCGPSR